MKNLTLIFLFFITFSLFAGEKQSENNPPVYIAFLWHMHQPIYYPYESPVTIDANNRFPFSVTDIHNQRIGPYTNWPADAVNKGIAANLDNFGAQVSFSGSLIENLNAMEAAGNGNFSNWKSSWNAIRGKKTALGNPRLDMVGFGYHHPLMGLIWPEDITGQIEAHKQALADNFPGEYSKGIFPPENAFAPEMIPALKSAGIEWVLVDNVHFERAAEGYPFSTEGGLVEPNKADITNPDPGDWVQLNGLWAPTRVSAQWARQPHYVSYTDPETGETDKMIAVPGDRYLGNEDGRGGFGALQYEQVMSQLESYNTDPDHPILIVLPHDGDNYGGGSESYYNSNFQSFVNWLQANPSRFVCTTIQDYLEMYPPDENDIIHVENGSWSGADNGDAEFKKWLGDPGTDGYSPDRNSWGIITAAKNYVEMAQAAAPGDGNTENALKYFYNSEASDYWYWDGSLDGIWDSNPARACNYVFDYAANVIDANNDATPPSIFKPQREPYNPGGTEWLTPQSSEFEVWTYVYDVSGLASVKLKYRTDENLDYNDKVYSAGTWESIDMTSGYLASRTDPMPTHKADKYSAKISGQKDVYVDYYVEAEDTKGNVSRSMIKTVWVGANEGSGSNSGVSWTPAGAKKEDKITVTIEGATTGAFLHWGVNNQGSDWQTPDQVYWPEGSALFNGTGPAVETPFEKTEDESTLTLEIGPFDKEEQTVNSVAFVIHYDNDSWDNNNGSDYIITFGTGGNVNNFVMDGSLDNSASLISASGNTELYISWQEPYLYVAASPSGENNNDLFIIISDGSDTQSAAPWGKSGTAAGMKTFLALEGTNGYNSWFDNSGAVTNGSGAYLEGTIDLEGEFGYIPEIVNISAAEYGTDDNAALVYQAPAGNGDGNIDANEYYKYDFTVTGITENNNGVVREFALTGNYPNPFNPSTNITFTLPEASDVTITVYDAIGREIGTKEITGALPGINQYTFDAHGLSSGVYFYRLEAVSLSGKSYNANGKMLLLR